MPIAEKKGHHVFSNVWTPDLLYQILDRNVDSSHILEIENVHIERVKYMYSLPTTMYSYMPRNFNPRTFVQVKM